MCIRDRQRQAGNRPQMQLELADRRPVLRPVAAVVHLHWYDKEVRPGRKVGHLNLTDSDTDRLSATLEAIKPLLPPEYTSGLFWAQSQLS